MNKIRGVRPDQLLHTHDETETYRPRNLLEAIENPTVRAPRIATTGMSERDLDTHVRRILRDLNAAGLDILGYHTHRSDRSEPGYPDWHFVGKRSMFRELKAEKGRVAIEQKKWIYKLQAAGQDADVWRPADLASGRIARELAALGRSGVEPRRSSS